MAQSIDLESRFVIATAGRGELEVTVNDYGVSFCSTGNILDLESGDGFTILWLY